MKVKKGQEYGQGIYSKISAHQLFEYTKNSMFSRPIKDRVSKIGSFKYLGFEYVYQRGKNGRLYLFINMYFEAVGAEHKVKGKKKREKYLLAIKFPYIQGLNNMQRMLDLPVKLFSSDPSFNFYLAYALNKKNAVILDNPKFKKWLDYAITHLPQVRNPDLKVELTKHFYKVIKFLETKKPKDFLNERYLTSIDKIKIPNEKDAKRWKKR